MKEVTQEPREITVLESAFHCSKCGTTLQVTKALRLLINRMNSSHTRQLDALKRKHEREMVERDREYFSLFRKGQTDEVKGS